MLFLLSRKKATGKEEPCWKMLGCPRERRESCPAWEYRLGTLCWFVNGTICAGGAQTDWKRKMAICRKCEVLRRLLKAR